MGKFILTFYGTERSDTDYTKLRCLCTNHNEIFIEIEADNSPTQIICLDKSTAIKFAKTIRTEINKMEEYYEQR